MQKTIVMVNGLSGWEGHGKMALALANQIYYHSKDCELLLHALRGPTWSPDVLIHPIHPMRLHSPETKLPEEVRLKIPSDVFVVDFTSPKAFLENGKYYIDNGWEFLMGTTATKEDVDALQKLIDERGAKGYIRPNLSNKITSFQSFVEGCGSSEGNRNIFNGCSLSIVESHQGPDPLRPNFHSKKDVSGTARKLVPYFNHFGINFNLDQIVAIRDRPTQLSMGIKPEHLDAHGWHTYTIRGFGANSNEALVNFDFVLKYMIASDDAFARDIKRRETVVRNKDQPNQTFVEDMTSINLDSTVYFKVSLERPATVIDGSETVLTITHNINGRAPYAIGALELIRAKRNGSVPH